ncbi:acyl-CoA thioester hydrolase [Virgibacillus natechei]|uniref:Acyl-CoA thioester hydrolase n=1 Tax=Virgibacillus natechei TaxID=1216297 RepID=A0ABS4IAJ7_9BACI|nr:thioesterase family protein [Virgibacillus natechei]MBP1967952.1 acyl-CoA thioester hydrolase [Virgibacillus natechei]UZD14759.1 acyl-CoA thioesterase [Virgibacillus natechei]
MNKVSTPIDVRYQETDQMGVVYHANYLVWFEIGRTKYIEELGFNYSDMEKNNVVSPVTDAQVSFKKPIRYGEEAIVETWLAKYDGIRTEYGYNIKDSDGAIAVSGTTQHVIVKKDNFRPLSLRKAFPDWHQSYIQQIEGE